MSGYAARRSACATYNLAACYRARLGANVEQT
jgi:hypothetical protein